MKYVQKNNISYLLIAFLLHSIILVGQRTARYDGKYVSYYQAEELMEKEQFSAARKKFEDFAKELNDEKDPFYLKAKYYAAISALALFNSDAIQQLMDFNQRFPENIYRNDIYFQIGLHFYQAKRYDNALEWLNKTNIRELDTAYRSEFYFKRGYVNFQLGNTGEARNDFFEIKGNSSIYGSPALYYFSHIAYQNKTYQVALEGFLKLLDDPAFASEVPYYITQIYYLLGQFDEVIRFAPTAIENAEKLKTPEMNQLIGDAYFRVGRYDEAIVYLEQFHKSGKPTREDKYQLGFAYLKANYFEKAAQMLGRVTQQDDNLAQIAAYHIAEAHMKLGRKDLALTAFRRASEVGTDQKIKEDALFNFAVLSYETDFNPYNQAIRAFEQFLNEFPNSKRTEDVYNYLVNVYTSTKRYAEALQSLDNIKNKDIRLKTTYQILAYNWGVELYEQGDFAKAITVFEKVKKFPVDSRISGKAFFWAADAHFQQQQYNEAIEKYKVFLTLPGNEPMKILAYYNIAYSYFNQELFEQAIESFRTFTLLPNNNDKMRLADAFIRIGDAYFIKTPPNFEQAVNNYLKAVEFRERTTDRALFYLAKTSGYIPERRANKIPILLDIVNNYRQSQYLVPAIFELGLSYKYENDFSNASKFFNQIIREHSKNILVKDALIELGDVLYKKQDFKEAEKYFLRALNEFNLDDERCKIATKGLQDIFRTTRQQERISELAKRYPCADISQDDEENFFFATANELYVKEKFDEAIPEIQKYITNFPNGRFLVQMLAALADIFYTREDFGQAVALYERIANLSNSAFTEIALIRLSRFYYNNENFEDALRHYKRLMQLSADPQVVYNSAVGVMRTEFLLDQFNNAAVVAQQVIENPLITERVSVEAHYIAGKSYFNQQQCDLAMPFLSWTEKNTGTARGAEALHLIAECHLRSGNIKKAEERHQQMMQRKPAYDFWIAKSLLLQARIFMKKDDLFQAEETVSLIMENYPIQDDGIKMEAEKLKAEISQLRNTPKNKRTDTQRVIEVD
ncbi:MAG: tetratricopeptide repeat protein [Crocinitomicaceae bacterium]|nr:tetratricopeptide repeat protein [Crocinitomicaceae bacterium]